MIKDAEVAALCVWKAVCCSGAEHSAFLALFEEGLQSGAPPAWHDHLDFDLFPNHNIVSAVDRTVV